MQKPVITFERHNEIGADLHDMRNRLQKMHAEAASSHGSRHQKKATRALFRAFEKINEARSSLEEVMFVDHPGQASVRIYYPGTEKSR